MLKLLFAAGGLVLLGLYGLGYGSTPRPAVPVVAPNPTAPLPTPAPNEFSVEVTDAALTEQLNARLAGQSLGDTPLGPASLRRVGVEFRNSQVLTSGDAQVGATSVPLSLSSTIDLVAGKPVVAVHEASAAGFPLPAVARRAIQQAMQTQLEAAVARRPMRIRSLTITSGKLLLIGAASS
jgi:hypothetical protein